MKAVRRVLIVSPHFPPDTSAGTHRVRLLAPHLPAYGWEPTVVSVDPRDYEGRLDPGLAALVPPSLRVIRARAWSPRWTRKLGIGDLGIRALRGLYHTCATLLQQERFDALYITIYPSYPAILGPRLKARFGVPFVLDYQDPWVGAWGLAVGGGPDGAPDVKSRVTRWVAAKLEPRTVARADAITAVSDGTHEEIVARTPALARVPRHTIPLGGEAADYDYLLAHPRANRFFDPNDGAFHLCYVGTLLPMGFETLRAVLSAACELRARSPLAYARLRMHFFGTSNQTNPDAPARVLPIAEALGMDCVREHAARVDYLDALTIQTQASAILMMGSSESHYTASKLYPGLLARRPILAVYHAASSVSSMLLSEPSPGIRLVTYDDTARAESRVAAISRALDCTIGGGTASLPEVRGGFEAYSASALAGRLAAVLDTACRARPSGVEGLLAHA